MPSATGGLRGQDRTPSQAAQRRPPAPCRVSDPRGGTQAGSREHRLPSHPLGWGAGAPEPPGGPLTEAERLRGSEAPSGLRDRAGLWDAPVFVLGPYAFQVSLPGLLCSCFSPH